MRGGSLSLSRLDRVVEAVPFTEPGSQGVTASSLTRQCYAAAARSPNRGAWIGPGIERGEKIKVCRGM